MKTPWTELVDKSLPLPEYPRPQMVRDNWVNLNGRWSYAINRSSKRPKEADGQIVVPFSPECELSEAEKSPSADDYLWYARSFTLPESFSGKRVLLHFGAVDQEAEVWVNDTHAVSHVGGYLPFEADITELLGDSNQLLVRVRDLTDESPRTRGKQKTKRGGIWYTPQSGIWQTVWLEAVPSCYVKALRITPHYDDRTVEVSAQLEGELPAEAQFNGKSYTLPALLDAQDCEDWTPENPALYRFTVTCGEDRVESYFAMRKVSVAADEKGVQRLMLNNKPYFHNGLLDQGYWPDGLYTAPTDEAMIHDIATAKAMGFNMLRKHIKVEPLRWYYHCDRLGMLVWQDMPCGGGKYAKAVVSAPLVTGMHLKDSSYALFSRSDATERGLFKKELREMIEHLYNCPCIALWVIFNEGWGQFDAARMYDFVQSLDETRVIDHASGWHDQGIGQVQSLHVYFKSYKFKPDALGRAVLLSEFGGYAHRVQGHCWGKNDFGYKSFESPGSLRHALGELYKEQIAPAYRQGLAAAVYTQLTDVEDELNGLMTYDRRVTKVAPELMRELVRVDGE